MINELVRDGKKDSGHGSTRMNDAEFTRRADATLARIAEAVDAAGLDCDCSLREDGVLEIEFEHGARVILNRHGAAKEIWIADRSGGFHFRPEGEQWLDTRDGSDLFAALSRLLSRHAGRSVSLG
jgi:CyaY protein